jgi:3-deoxy-D-manno-octulosonate 8-phosphate phosphatase (KDO 8-P phosphatase)
MLSDTERRFRELGGRFVTPAAQIAANLRGLRALVFDWDGVFNSGVKGAGASGFSEPDSMGTNMLRFALWRERGTQPVCAVVSGADNPAAREFAKREHFHDVYCGIRDKSLAFASFVKTHDIRSSAVAYVFDDINDLAVARACGLRILVRRDASPLFLDHVARHGLCDYITAHESGRYAVREACELLIGLLEQYEAVVTARSNVDPHYEAYFAERQRLATEIHDAP